MRNKPFYTNYRLAWIEFRKTEDFRVVDGVLKDAGHKPRFRRSLIMRVFQAGWHATNTEIKQKEL